jgi:hypothetical protein
MEDIKQEVMLSFDKQCSIIDEALKAHYRETMERKRVPSDYLLMFTEGGESGAVADAIAQAAVEKVLNHPRVRIMCENQDLPEHYHFEFLHPVSLEKTMTTPDKDGNVWVKVVKKWR